MNTSPFALDEMKKRMASGGIFPPITDLSEGADYFTTPRYPMGEKQKVTIQQKDVSFIENILTYGSTSIEEAISGMTFGAWKPDIVGEEMEEASPKAATVGKIVGSVGGFLASMKLM
ncbi:MAG: hypothetical protein ABID54_13955, partial [Pseudomonadota bacterium]